MSTIYYYLGQPITVREEAKQEVGVHYYTPTSKRTWTLSGTTSRDAAMAICSQVIPALDIRGGVACYFENYDLKEKSTGVWEATANWKRAPVSYDLSVDTTGGTGKILQSIRTKKMISLLSPSVFGLDPGVDISELDPPPNFKRAIGVTANGVDGVDVTVQKFDFSVNYKWKFSTLASTYLKTIYDMTGCVNSKNFDLAYKGEVLTFAAGDLKFLGAPMRQTSDDELDINYRFSAIKGISVSPPAELWKASREYKPDYCVDARELLPNENNVVYRCLVDHVAAVANAPPNPDFWDLANLAVGDGPPIEKQGWDYLWVYYEDRTDPDTNRIVKRPRYAYIEQVYRRDDFDKLQLNLLGI